MRVESGRSVGWSDIVVYCRLTYVPREIVVEESLKRSHPETTVVNRERRSFIVCLFILFSSFSFFERIKHEGSLETKMV